MELIYEFSIEKQKVQKHVNKKTNLGQAYVNSVAHDDLDDSKEHAKHEDNAAKKRINHKDQKKVNEMTNHRHAYVNSAYDDLDDIRENIDSDVVDIQIRRGCLKSGKCKHDGGFGKLHETSNDRKISVISQKASLLKKRTEGLVVIRGIIEKSLSVNFKQANLQALLMDRDFTLVFFCLFDRLDLSTLDQTSWFGQLRHWAKDTSENHTMAQNKLNLVEFIEAITYNICQENSVTADDFHEIISTRFVADKILKVLKEDTNNDLINVDRIMSFILTTTHGSQLNDESTERLKKLFQKTFGIDKTEIDLKDFKKIIPCKDQFFSSRIFSIFDQDGSGQISLAEFIETVDTFSTKDDDFKIKFLFRICDVDGDGAIKENEFKQVITACMKENGMDFEDEEVSKLAHGLFVDGDSDESGEMTLDEFHEQLHSHEGLVEGLGIMINKWLVPPKPVKEKSFLDKICNCIPQRYFSKEYWQNNKSFLSTICLIMLINLALITERAYYFRNFSTLNGFTPNPFYLISRACGRTLLFNSVLVVLLVLRNSISLLRRIGLASYLPLDNNIYLHKFVGVMMFLQASLHTIMHLSNFAINIQPNPVKFLQLTYKYWLEHYGVDDPLTLYSLPPGCKIVDSSSPDSEHCLPGSLEVPSGLNIDSIYNNGSFVCQSCDEKSSPWSYVDWIFTTKPQMFGLLAGSANPTGVALICILIIMFVCSLPFIRRRGHFELFYFTHLLYNAYFVLLLLHAPNSKEWFAVVLTIWVAENIYRLSKYFGPGRGKTVIKAGEILPSRVTKLIIERPHGFNFSPGDWVFVKIPAVASNEWHPFTISSAPEVAGQLTLHIRGVGGWTNGVYTLFKSEYERLQMGERIQAGLSKMVKCVDEFEGVEISNNSRVEIVIPNRELEIKKTGQPAHFDKPLEINIDGPFGSPSSNIYQAEHAVLIGTGIGVTPFASILQSIMQRYQAIKKCCPNCSHRWTSGMEDSMSKLKKVDFFWINRDQKSFEWFVNLLSQLETEQAELGGALSRFLDMHMYVTSALQRTDMKAVALQLALDILHKREDRDLITGLKARTNAGRPNWNKVFTKLKEEKRGQITVFYCGNPMLAKTLRLKCEEFGFQFRKETF
eukprot:GFUD01019688.1.p1 GENE.GFUD01019688.1~~GFUD01019688.1.p1  ORF type:complete len:1116 (+),score=193.24 GFUD01019688.1:205-3552(+)